MDNNKLSKNELLCKFQSFLVDSNYLIIGCKQNENINFFYDYDLIRDNKKMKIHANVKKISNAFFPNNDSVLRIQTGPIDVDLLPENSKNEISILVGFINFNNVEIIAIWNAFYFVGHKKNRSCYLTLDNLIDTTNEGYLITDYANTPVYISTKERMDIVIKEFIDNNIV